MTELIQVRNIFKSYDGASLLQNVSLTIHAGEVVCLLGPSGTGKTTLLRIIAGLEIQEAGQVLYEGRDLRNVPVHQRGFGLMFQDLALFPHRTVAENVAFGLRMHNLRGDGLGARVNEALDMVGLDPARFARRDVNHLSGGEQQRVALARSLAPRPRFLMFDEPLGALDRILREQLAEDLRNLLKRIGMTALYVTHDQEEAFVIADRLVIIKEGQVAQSGAPAEVYGHPASAFVARFLGLTNLVPTREIVRAGDLVRAVTDAGIFVLPAAQRSADSAVVLLRPTAVRRAAPAIAQAENVVRGVVAESMLYAGHTRVLIAAGASHLTFEWEESLPIGSHIEFDLTPDQIQLLPH
ncbi:MAG: ABC transporter ATP-binding protein [Anaerolineae bacterium]